jgi:hypothetical protein
MRLLVCWGLVGLFIAGFAVSEAAAAKKLPPRCKDGCLSYCTKRFNDKTTHSIAACQRVCQRNSCRAS